MSQRPNKEETAPTGDTAQDHSQAAELTEQEREDAFVLMMATIDHCNRLLEDPRVKRLLSRDVSPEQLEVDLAELEEDVGRAKALADLMHADLKSVTKTFNREEAPAERAEVVVQANEMLNKLLRLFVVYDELDKGGE